MAYALTDDLLRKWSVKEIDKEDHDVLHEH
jgi:hypothetical protein